MRDRYSASTLEMVAGTGYSDQQDGEGGLDGFMPEYGLPTEPATELVRLDMPEVPVGSFLQQSRPRQTPGSRCIVFRVDQLVDVHGRIW